MKTKLLCAFLLLCIVLSGCAKNNDESTETTVQTTAKAATTTVQTTPETTKANNPTVEDLYGYYLIQGHYMRIEKDYYETKYLPEGSIGSSAKINSIKEIILDDCTTEFIIDIDWAMDEPMILYINKNKELCTQTGDICQRIDKETYDNIVYTEPPTVPKSRSNPYDCWYAEAFDMYTTESQLQEIENLLATGKKGEAAKLIETNIFGKIENKIDEFLDNREYWAAQNYVAMYNVLLNDTYYWYGCSYPFINKYFEEDYTDSELANGASRNFNGYTQKYFVEIAKKVYADSNYISKEECLYLVNEVLINNGENVTNVLYSDAFDYEYAYVHGVYHSNSDDDYYYYVCPYSQNVYYVPYLYSYIQDSIVSDWVMKNYFS